MKDRVIIGSQEFITLVALSEEEQAKGLMYQAWPPPVMAFPFKNAEVRKFWMKNTPSPLDILFCREGKVIALAQGEPYSCRLVGPNSESDLVIELPLGHVEKYNIRIGTPIQLKYSLKTFAKENNLL